MSSIKLSYFDLPGRAESIRIFLKISGIEFEDNRVSFQSWPEVKSTYAPYFQLPVLEFDGKRIAQSNNILLFLADYFSKDNALVPSELIERYQCFQHIHANHDILATVDHTYSIQDKENKFETRTKLISPGGATHANLSKFNDILKTQKYLHGDHLTVSDLSFFGNLAFLFMLDGMPKEKISEMFPEISAYYQRLLDDEKHGHLFKEVEEAYVSLSMKW